MMTENLIPIGISIIIIGFALVIVGAVLQTGKGKSEFAVVGFIGPIPIGFGSNKNILAIATIITLVLFLLFVFLVRGK